jgi:predicted TIM-barrel fold metal-dependent hydrolase
MGWASARPTISQWRGVVVAMDAVGVHAAIIVSTFNLYRYDPSYALEVYGRYPDRFRAVKPIDVTDPQSTMFALIGPKTKGAVGVWIMPRDEVVSDPADARLNRAFAAAGRHSLPVNFLCWGRLDDGAELIRRNADTVIVIDHLGLLQPNQPPEPWPISQLLALASYPNVRVKVSGACHAIAEAIPIRRHLGAGLADHRCIRH